MKKTLSILALTLAFVLPVSLHSQHGKTKTTPLSPATLAERSYQYRQILSILQNNYVDSLDMENLVAEGIRAMLAAVDPYTEYYTSDNLDELTTVSSGNYGGIGSAIQARDSVVIMSAPYYGKPAALAGIRHGDVILQIDDYVLPKNADVSDISSRLKGNPGTHVVVKVKRPWLENGADSIFVFDIERQKVSIDPVPFTTVFDDGIALLEVSTFNQNTADQIRKRLEEIKAREGKNLRGVIVDLRDNGGGLLESAVNLLSLFLDRGTRVVETRYRGDAVETYKTRKSPVDTKIPLVVLVNGGTASASEIVSGAIQDLDRGVIMGRRTFGKGLVQTSAPVGFGDVLKYTTGKYYLPSGRLVQALDYRDADGKPTLIPDSLTTQYTTANGRTVRDGRGVSPDVELEGRTASQLAWQLYAEQMISDYANRYRNTHDAAPELTDTLVTDSLYADFKTFVDPAKLQYGKASRAAISYLREAAKVEGLETDSITAAIDSLEQMLQHDLNHELDANKDEIVEMLVVEIAERYYPSEHISSIIVVNDRDVIEARKLLLDAERYGNIIKKQ